MNSNTQDFINIKLAISKSDIGTLDYFLNHPDEDKKFDIHFDDDIFLQLACYHQQYEIIKYLLTSPYLHQHSNIHANNNYCLTKLAYYYNIELLDYITSLKESDNQFQPIELIHAFSHACYVLNQEDTENISVVSFYINQLNIMEFPETSELLKSKGLKAETLKLINSIYEKKTSFNHLSSSLNITNLSEFKKPKI